MNKVLMLAVLLSAIASILLYMAIYFLVPRYNDFPGGGICFHRPQEIVDHTIEPKLFNGQPVNLDLLSGYG